ncbi:hypothetical protein [Acinetobacter sp. ANC 3813]|uniref:hypothetical protein n=1 Tax=Acinetobacter sp. ANC 3813 TaxID=1977873 RepID=UPI000A356402|nr:hypothetical protein [Acinetobacter sp. ANC 3813]OTG87903.1 hypothetical protein B9T34_16345 [Acinetobacter sp. ANC 3813]
MHLHKKIRRSRPPRIFKKLAQRAAELLVKHGEVKEEHIGTEDGEYVVWTCSTNMDGTEWDYTDAYDYLCMTVANYDFECDAEGNYIPSGKRYKNPSAFFKAFIACMNAEAEEQMDRERLCAMIEVELSKISDGPKIHMIAGADGIFRPEHIVNSTGAP